MKVNYFDLGFSLDCAELDEIIVNIFPSLNIENYTCYAFDACREYSVDATKKYLNDDRVNILNYAISEKDGIETLYHHFNKVGHSIFKSKTGVYEDKYETVESIVFSEWVEKNVPDFKESFNIMKVNIEGAEWHLFRDMEKNDMIKHFDIFCGAGHDVEKIGELSDKVDEYWKLIKKNNIVMHRFCQDWHPERNADIKQLIKDKL